MKIFHLGILKRHYQWEAASSIIVTLEDAGFKAYLAGGCVRDGLLGRRPNDLDVATSATPEQVESLFHNTVSVGKQFGVIRVLWGDSDIEVATFRKDGLYVDGRRPETIEYSSPEEDAQRRDFTINALFYDIGENKIYDYVGGLDDLNQQRIVAVGIPAKRFEEDRLRVLRALRFVSQLGFHIEKETFKAIQATSYKIKDISGERIHEEMNKLFLGIYRFEAVTLLKPSGLEQALFPNYERSEWLDIPLKEFWQYLVLFLRKQKNKSQVIEWIDFLKLSKVEKKLFVETWDLLNSPESPWKRQFGQQVISYASPAFRTACEIWAYQNLFVQEITKLHSFWLEMNEKLPAPLLRGEDLMPYFKGPQLGQALDLAFSMQIEQSQLDKSQLLYQVQNKLSV